MTNNELRKENISKLEKLAKEVLLLKNLHRQRRPIIIEFCGSPKAGKTSSINSLNIFLKRNGFKTSVLTERASICPISDKESPVFNTWTCTTTINEINRIMDMANSSPTPENNLDIIMCDRGIFDAICWFRWLQNRDKMEQIEYDVMTKFALLERWQKNIDLVYVFLTNPEVSIEREYANLLTEKRGSIMREDILAEYKFAVNETIERYKNTFRAIRAKDTTQINQNDLSYEITEQTLITLKEMLMEKIGYFNIRNISLSEGINDFSVIPNDINSINFDLREKVESTIDYIQPIAVAAITSKDGKKILCVKKTAKSTEKSSPESGHNLLYVGGHMRMEDKTANCSTFQDILRNTLKRELFEELGVSIAIDKKQAPTVLYTPDSKKSKKHLAFVFKISLDEKTKLNLDAYELVQKKGGTKSGTFIAFNEITNDDMKFESWSKTILLNLFPEKLSDEQKDKIKGEIKDTTEQLNLFND